MSGPLFDATLEAVARGMDVRARRQSVLASNLANLDTPHYVPRDLDFKEALRREVESLEASPLARTSPGHLTGTETGTSGGVTEAVERPDRPAGADGNAVDLDRQLARASVNSGAYGALARAAQKKIAMLKYVMQE